MKLVPYLNFDGNCAEAFRFYEQVFGGKLEAIQTHGESAIKDQVPPDWHDRILHARLVIGDQILMASDTQPGTYEGIKGMNVAVQIDDVERAERIFNALAENGSVQMPFQDTFWGARFGMLVDRFGIPWMINCEQKAA